MTENKKTYLLDDILEERNKVLNEIRLRETNIKNKFTDLATPDKQEGKINMFVGNIDRLFAIYDGAMVGFKILRSFRHPLKKRR